MSSDADTERIFSIIALESGIEYPDFENAPDEPLLVEVQAIQEEDLVEICHHFDIDLDDLRDLQDYDERPRLQVEDRFTMLVLRVPVNLEVTDREYSTFPVGVFTNGRDIVILRHQRIPLRKDRLMRKIRLCTTAAEVIYVLWEIVIGSFEHMLDVIEATINSIEDSIFTEIYPSQLNRFFQLSRDAVFMEAALKADMKVLRRLMRLRSIGRMVLDEDRLEDLEVDLQQQLELSAIYRDLIDNAMNAYDSIVNHNLNKVMKTLTSISLVAMIPTLIASIYGMNVGLPFQNEAYAFLMLILISVIITIPVLVYLKIRSLV
ncbi:MAG: magnesium transporter CorA family protein [Candidatus Thorarchaeota archaeon]|nr:magnesium transporter CorA family protein [Candidatus Thorarchaeota archaeon]